METLSKAQIEYIKRVTKARMSKGCTHQEIANYIGVARNTYSNYEAHRPMPQKYQSRFCSFTNVEEKWLISGEGEMKKNAVLDKEFQQIESAWQGFDENCKTELTNFTRDLKNIQDRKDKLK